MMPPLEPPIKSINPTTGLCIYVLGPLRIEWDNRPIHLPRRKVESLLAYLLLHPQPHTRDQLATLLWPDTTDAQARHSLRTALATIRQLLTPELLLTDREHVQWNTNFPLWVDLYHLLALQDDFDTTSPEQLQLALALWQNDLLAGLYDDWLTLVREHYQTQLLQLFLHITQSYRTASHYAQAIAVAQRILHIDPANEHAHQHLMFCYVAAGDRPAALRQYELCVQALQAELDAPPLPETAALYHWIKQYEGDAPASAAQITNLPLPLSSFIGRTRETAAIKRLLTATSTTQRRTTRLLTLTGAGGSGKTRLAIQAATDLIDSFAGGVWWVELAALSDDALVVRALAKSLGVSEQVDEPLPQTLARRVANHALLLVLDNCEHVIEACAHLVAELLVACPQLQILTTSREPLNIQGEQVWQVPTFAVPDPAQLEQLEGLEQFESVRLFVERATAVQPTFALTPDNAQAVVEICQRLDGIPLAIELAAARVKVLAVEQIALYVTGAVGARFTLLTQGSRRVLPRHQTLRAAIEWSYQLLDDAERLLFRLVAVYRGGFTLELLEELVASGSPSTPASIPYTLDLLTQLVDKSLVMVEQAGSQPRREPRYHLLETLREYALEQYPSVRELKRIQQRHATTFLALAQQAEPELSRGQQQLWLNRLEAEHANLRAALDYWIAEAEGAGRGEEALQLAAALHRFWEVRGHVSEGRTWLQAALAKRARATPLVLANALNAAGRLAYRQGDLTEGLHVHTEALQLYMEINEETGIAASLTQLGVIEMERGNFAIGQQRMEAALAISRKLNDELGIAYSLSRLGVLAWELDNYAASAEYHRESLAIYKRHNVLTSVAQEALSVGDSERMLGNWDSARKHCEECLTIAQRLGYRRLVGSALKSLGLLAARQGDLAQARQYGEEALKIFRQLGDKVHIGFSLSHLGEVAQNLGEYSQALAYFGQYLQIMFEAGYKWPTYYALEDIAYLLTEAQQYPEITARFLGAADALREQTGLDVAPNFQEKYARMLAILRQHFGDGRFDTLRQEGAATPLAQIVTQATQLLLT